MIACGGSDDEGEAQYDFGFTASDDFGMSDALSKIDCSDISKQLSKLETMMNTAVKKALPGSYSTFSDYEEDDDPEKSFLETGVYHNKIGYYISVERERSYNQ